jgi:hypothetical protein
MRAITTLLAAFVLASCADTPTSTATVRPFPNVVPPDATRGPGPVVDCSTLLTTEELALALDTDIAPIGWNLNSCYWTTRSGTLQLVLMTGPDAGTWFGKLSEGDGEGTLEPVDGYDFGGVAGPGSFGGFVPGRAALFHGINDHALAAELIRLALTRL